MNAYMAWDNIAGSHEGALLVFAVNVQQARVLARPYLRNWFDTEMPAVRAKRLKADFAHMRTKDEPHVIESPPSCESCEMWYDEPLNDAGLCATCADELSGE